MRLNFDTTYTPSIKNLCYELILDRVKRFSEVKIHWISDILFDRLQKRE